ncbi:hypothetical protein SASPL_105428 [Salvia splendens]|uniref:Glycosyl transferase family 28 C-terminal domain-containing protein n=1 Tax=Salvia splendens TaxID=180675 RepID=A0A8X9AAR0_SALSN|nr:hypothetical protein SASPL_105428 [Salvia splendens]
MGEIDDISESKSVVFVTVGTTSFDALVRAVDSQEVREALFRKGYTDLVIQMGRGSYIPSKVVKADFSVVHLCSGEDGSLSVDYFTFSSSIAEYLKSASLVISHAGSGSIFETLRLRKPLIVVVNEDLMDNHQSELAEELAERNHLFCARPQTLYETISAMDPNSLVPYQPGDATPVAKFINSIQTQNSEKSIQDISSKISENKIFFWQRDVSEDWQQVDEEGNSSAVKDNFFTRSSVFPPGNHEDLPITNQGDERQQEMVDNKANNESVLCCSAYTEQTSKFCAV